MIVQTASSEQPNFVIEQSDHARTAGQIAAAFGNEQFAPPHPAELMAFVASHHDEGWVPVDAMVSRSPATGLPQNLTQTPITHLLMTCKSSPDFNQANHPLCGLLSSMHCYGLFTGRYGLSTYVLLDNAPEDKRPAIQTMLDNELERQEKLKAELPPELADPAFLMTQYKLLQFFDTLALYFQMTHAEKRKSLRFQHIPDGSGADRDIVIRPQSENRYMLDPWPFNDDEVILTTQGRYMYPQPEGTDFNALFAVTPREIQVYRLISPA